MALARYGRAAGLADLAQAAIPAMRAEREGWIANVSSATARPWAGPPFTLGTQGATTTAYGASKAALNRMTNGLAAELHGTGIRVNTIEPRGAVLTEGAEALMGGKLPVSYTHLTLPTSDLV